ncbi:MAG: hypothetical protein C0501_24470 [Isosphaera sp.]|nr:hypothetical protein [Isosphaera sp.]
MSGGARIDRRRFLGAAAAATLGGPLALARQGPAEKKVEPVNLPLDRADIWTLHFNYKTPRIVTLDALDAGGRRVKKVVWYMWFQVYNLSGEPQTFLPEFELVTKDLNTTHLDQPEPFLLRQLEAIENPTAQKQLELKSTIGISKRPIPPSLLVDAIPIPVTGAAVWTDLAEKAPKTNKFSVYITGLSNGLAVQETPTGEKLIQRKTLQINFLRPTDDNRPQPTDIVRDDANGAAERWIYRTASTIKPKAP